jgi:hypothetical protein
MAYTNEQYLALKEAIAGGELSVRYADRNITYRSIDEMLRIQKLMEAELFPSSGSSTGGRRLTSFSKGY